MGHFWNSYVFEDFERSCCFLNVTNTRNLIVVYHVNIQKRKTLAHKRFASASLQVATVLQKYRKEIIACHWNKIRRANDEARDSYIRLVGESSYREVCWIIMEWTLILADKPVWWSFKRQRPHPTSQSIHFKMRFDLKVITSGFLTGCS